MEDTFYNALVGFSIKKLLVNLFIGDMDRLLVSFMLYSTHSGVGKENIGT